MLPQRMIPDMSWMRLHGALKIQQFCDLAYHDQKGPRHIFDLGPPLLLGKGNGLSSLEAVHRWVMDRRTWRGEKKDRWKKWTLHKIMYQISGKQKVGRVIWRLETCHQRENNPSVIKGWIGILANRGGELRRWSREPKVSAALACLNSSLHVMPWRVYSSRGCQQLKRMHLQSLIFYDSFDACYEW